MDVFEIQNAFGLENLKPATRPKQALGHHQVRVEVKAVSLNFRDLMTVLGTYNPRQPLPLIPCSDGAGQVVEVGEGVTRFKKGDRVAAIFAQDWLAGPPTLAARKTTLGGPLDGMLARQVVLGQRGLVAAPDHLTWEEAACLPCAGVTAWHALMEKTPLKPGQTVLLQGTGGVSLFALQFARIAGARAIITSSSDEKLSRAKELGAWECINYKSEPDWDKRVLGLTEGEGVDHVIEVGGGGTLERSLKAVRVGGTVSVIGALSGAKTELAVTLILMKSVRVQGIFVGSREIFEAMNRAVALHHLKPAIDRVFPFEEAPEAFALMQSRGHFGKIAIRVA
jgi:NADPH:quinone reductase-like Zn-dependent oxidoreductase